MGAKMYKYFFAICVFIPFEIYGYSLTQTDIDKIKKTYAESAFSSICSKVCQRTYQQPEEVKVCAKGCLRGMVDTSISHLKSNVEKLKIGSVNRCTAKLKASFSGEAVDSKEFDKLVQQCADQEVSQVMTKMINDFPTIIQQGIQSQGGVQKVEQSILRQMQQTANPPQGTQ